MKAKVVKKISRPDLYGRVGKVIGRRNIDGVRWVILRMKDGEEAAVMKKELRMDVRASG